MSKNKIRQITATAMLTALSIILERYITVTPASNMMDIRITFSNVPVILAGLLVSPFFGGVCGVVSDIVGCVLSGYPPFPLLTLAPLITGFLPAFIFKLVCENNHDKNKAFAVKQTVLLLLAIFVSHILSSVIVTTYGLSVMRGTPFIPMLITRIPSSAVCLVIDCVVVSVLYTPLCKVAKK